MNHFSIWLQASRPKTLWVAFVPVFMGGAMAFHDGGFHLLSFTLALLGAILLQIGTNLSNDYFDHLYGADNENRLGPTRATQAGLVSPTEMKRAFLIIYLLSFLVGLFLAFRAGFPILILGLICILSGHFYTARPFRFGYRGLGDLFVLVFFGPIAVGGTYYVQTLELNAIPFIAGLSAGLISMAILTINNLRDFETDAKAGKRTLVVRFGTLFGKWEYFLTIFVACLIPIYLSFRLDAHYFSICASLVLLLALPLFKTVFRESGAVLNPLLGKTGKLLFIFGVLFSIGWVL